MKKLVLAYSGGLDTSYCVKHLSQQGYEVHAVSVNTGGFDAEEIDVLSKKAMVLGATSYQSIDAVETFYQKVIRFLVYGNVLKNNTYPLSVSAERIVQAVEIVNYAKSINATHIAHGSTGAGNDQVRFDLIFQTLAPDIEIITPIRDQKLSREDEIQFLKSHGVEMEWTKAQYSVNKGLWGTSVGGKETLTSKDPLPEEAYPSQLINETPKTIALQFTKGQLSGIDGEEMNAVLCIQKLETIASAYAIGRDIHVGDTIIGIKGRVGFEAAAPLLIIKAHHLLEKHTLSKWQQQQKEQLSSFYGMHLHEGHYLDPVLRDIEAFMESSQQMVTGTVFVTLHPYRFTLDGIESPHDLMDSSFGSYGEMNLNWTSDDAKGFINVTANATKIYKHVNKS
ncbi:MAG: argininosuccinate synthase [Bacteroidota bacterium]|nr:argininosuccinate synthase [Bacteroidota bacterium]